MFGSASNLRERQKDRYSEKAAGQPAQRLAMDVDCFFSMIILYLRLAFRALRPCQGRRPLRK